MIALEDAEMTSLLPFIIWSRRSSCSENRASIALRDRLTSSNLGEGWKHSCLKSATVPAHSYGALFRQTPPPAHRGLRRPLSITSSVLWLVLPCATARRIGPRIKASLAPEAAFAFDNAPERVSQRVPINLGGRARELEGGTRQWPEAVQTALLRHPHPARFLQIPVNSSRWFESSPNATLGAESD